MCCIVRLMLWFMKCCIGLVKDMSMCGVIGIGMLRLIGIIFIFWEDIIIIG